MGGKPAAEITWIDGSGNVITRGIEYVKEPYDQESRRFTAKSILKFTPKRKYHNTEITCQAQNTADRTYRSAKLTLEVKYAPKVEVKVVGDSLVDGRIPEGAEVRLSCITDAYPKEVEYKWYINDEEVVGDYNTFMVRKRKSFVVPTNWMNLIQCMLCSLCDIYIGYPQCNKELPQFSSEM